MYPVAQTTSMELILRYIKPTPRYFDKKSCTFWTVLPDTHRDKPWMRFLNNYINILHSYCKSESIWVIKISYKHFGGAKYRKLSICQSSSQIIDILK